MMTKFNVGDKVRILNVDAITFGDGHYYTGMETEVVELFLDEYPKLRNQRGASGISIRDNEYHAIELITDKPKKSARITALETQVAALEAKVEALESAGKYPLTARFNQESTEVDAILADIERKAKPTLATLLATYPTANERRADVIRYAKHYVKSTVRIVGMNLYGPDNRVQFLVNTQKRTVVALTRMYESGDIIRKGIAKCDPDDVFNADIGKAIALARALGVEVPQEFVKAVQPTEKVYYHVVESEKYGKYVITPTDDPEGTHKYDECALVSPAAEASRIIEDSIAVYE